MQHLLIILYITLWSISSSEDVTKDKPWPQELNTASDAAYLSDLERDVIFELNKVRSDPPRYAKEYLEEVRKA
jgi:hypothetical protein